MNAFLQRMLKKNSNEELNVQKEKGKGEKEKKKNETGRSGSSKGNWIRKLGNYSPTNYQVPSNPMRTNAMRPVDMNSLCNTYEQATPMKTSGSPKTTLEMPDLESIIREFETGFLSPTKSPDTSIEFYKQKNFVKKIVAAFEVKYKSYNDLREAQKLNENQEDSLTRIETPKRRTSVFSNHFKSNFEESNQHEESKNSRSSGVFGSPFKASAGEIKVPNSNKSHRDEIKKESRISKDHGENLENRKKPKSLFVSYRDSSNSSEIYTYPVDCPESKDSSLDSPSVFKINKEKIERSNFLLSPSKTFFLDETVTVDSVDLDFTLPEPEETILLEENALLKTSTMLDQHANYEDDDDCFIREVSKVDKTPRIVGAFLKEPIEVEDTSIDWIPITGKRLPRKRSLKKLLNALTGKKSLEKKSKLFSSERNLYEEPRELQDSGYDEKSCSSSSLNSMISITEVLLQQENSYMESEKRGGTLTTFKPNNSVKNEGDEVFSNTYPKQNRKNLLLTEVPREHVKLDLGPSYPPSFKLPTMSLDRKTISKKIHPPSPVRSVLTKLPKHPHLSTIPKHPFVSLTKMDELQETPNSQESQSNEEPSVIVKNDLYEVEFCRSDVDICSAASCRSSSSAESNYDVPRRFLSKSENELRLNSEGNQKEQPVYDVPKSTVLERPKSNDYEDIVSLRRRSTQLTDSVVPSFYAIPRPLGVRYTIAKPTNSKVYSNKGILRSLNDLTVDEMRSTL